MGLEATAPASPGGRQRFAADAELRAAALRGFRRSWFLPPDATRRAPLAPHIRLLNDHLLERKRDLVREARALRSLAGRGADDPELFRLRRQRFEQRYAAVQLLWDFFFDAFSQRRSVYERFLRTSDRIASDVHRRFLPERRRRFVGTPPLVYLDKGRAPATIRRGVPLSQRGPGAVGNPFPVIKVPYDRSASPWLLTGLAHELGHVIQGEVLGLREAGRRAVENALREASLPPLAIRTWSTWSTEAFADLLAFATAGPAAAFNLVDLVSGPRAVVMRFDPRDSHPTPYLRVLLAAHALRRLGLGEDAERIERSWLRRYPRRSGDGLPAELVDSAPRAIALVTEQLLERRYPELGDRSLLSSRSYTPSAHGRVLRASRALLAGRRATLSPRLLLVSAAALAFQRRPDRGRVIRAALFRSLGVEPPVLREPTWASLRRRRPIRVVRVVRPRRRPWRIPPRRIVIVRRPGRRPRRIVILRRLRPRRIAVPRGLPRRRPLRRRPRPTPLGPRPPGRGSRARRRIRKMNR